MEVILLEKIHKLGGLGETVKVKPGFGRNFLIPQGKAVRATADNEKLFESRRAELEKKAADLLGAAQKRAEKLADMTITITAMASDEGKLFGSIQPADIADAINAAGGEVEKREVVMAEGSIRSVGEYHAHVHFHSDVVTPVAVIIEAAK